jgi:hypothetical protein
LFTLGGDGGWLRPDRGERTQSCAISGAFDLP